ncbi:biotin/lipoate A/B protein ligase family protein [Paenibacillus sp. UNC496MF]|uniref:lipoate--protein ligase family protein n=1 Tax=Paenibacillus sp. UNC496MF TaxID=1502753 RepID=UPI00352844FA
MWRFVHTGVRSAAENMAIDEAMMTAHARGLAPPTLRFYGWREPTLSVGRFQRAERDVDFAALEARGVAFVRRPTGGRAVLHDRELTYSLVVAEGHPGLPAGVAKACAMLSAGLLGGFRRLGLDARPFGGGSGGDAPAAAKHAQANAAAGPPSPGQASAACFDAPAEYEIVVEGRKIAGSAQMRADGVLLQHGSVPMELDAGLLHDVLRFPDAERRRRMRAAFERHAVAINPCLRRKGLAPAAIGDLEAAFLAGFAELLGVEPEPGALTAFETELAGRLAAEKYGADAWNLRR